MIHSIRQIAIIFIFGLIFVPAKSRPIAEGSKLCLGCHASQSFTIYNEWTEMNQKRLMNPFYIIDTVQFVNGVHGGFECIDCHSYEYETYPHGGELKLEPLMTCIDCHGGDDTYASYKFEKVDEEFKKSIHYEKFGDLFTCSKCHDQHYYRPIARNAIDMKDIARFSNDMCLSCHSEGIKYELVSDEEKPRLLQVHDWLPNQELHFERVRCIECHTEAQDSLMVSHDILSKDKANKNCVSCHSSNSILQASLYKYQNLKTRAEAGETNAGHFHSGFLKLLDINNIFPGEYYVIGASRIPVINLLFAIVFICTAGGIIIHTVFRIFKK